VVSAMFRRKLAEGCSAAGQVDHGKAITPRQRSRRNESGERAMKRMRLRLGWRRRDEHPSIEPGRWPRPSACDRWSPGVIMELGTSHARAARLERRESSDHSPRQRCFADMEIAVSGGDKEQADRTPRLDRAYGVHRQAPATPPRLALGLTRLGGEGPDPRQERGAPVPPRERSRVQTRTLGYTADRHRRRPCRSAESLAWRTFGQGHQGRPPGFGDGGVWLSPFPLSVIFPKDEHELC